MASQSDQDRHEQPNNNNNNSSKNNNSNNDQSNITSDAQPINSAINKESALGQGPSYRNRPPPPLITPNRPGVPAAYPPPSTMVYPPPTGMMYPPQSPGQAPNYPPMHHHPPPPYNYAYTGPHAHAQAPPAQYYYAAHNGAPVLPGRAPAPIAGFLRGVLIAALLFIIVSIIATFISTAFFPKDPIFRVSAFSVSNFNASSTSSFTSTWDVALSIQNVNSDLQVYIDRGDSYVSLADDSDNSVLASSFIQSFSIDAKSTTVLRMRLAANNTSSGEAGLVPQGVVAAIDIDKRSDGLVNFNLWATFIIQYKASALTDSNECGVYCSKLGVVFYNNGSSGTLPENSGQGSQCDFYVLR